MGISYGQIPATINSSGTWSSSTGSGPITFAAGSCYAVTVTAWGGGGGGGGAISDGASGGGAGGGYAQGVVSISGGSICYYRVGAGGTAGTTAGNNGGAGGPTWFNGTSGTNNNTTGSFINASGGAGGNGATTNVGAAAQTTVGTGTFGTSGVTSTISYSGGTGGGGFVNGGGDGGGGGGGGGAGAGGNGGNGATTIVGGSGLFGCPNGGGAGGGGGGGASGPGANGTPGNSNGGGGTGGAANGGGAGGTGSASAAGTFGTGTPGGAGMALGGGGGAGNGCCGCSGGAGGDGAPGGGSIGGGGGGGTGDGGGGNGGNGGSHGGGGAGADGASSASGGTGGVGYLTIQVTVVTAPTANAGPALAPICESGTSSVMNGSISIGATAIWSGGTGTWTNANDPANTSYTAGPGETGTITLTLTATNACGTITATKNLTINPAPAAPAVTSPVTYCQNFAAVPLTATGTNLLWYTTATGGVGSATAPTPSTAVSGSTTYYVSQTQTGCESPRASIVVTINPAPAGPTVTSPVTYCQNTTAVPLTATGTNLLWYTTATGGVGSATAPTPSTTASGSTSYYVSQTQGGCESPRATILVTVNPTPAAPTVTSPVIYCQNATAAPLTATGTNLLWYTVAIGGVGSAIAPSPSTTASGSTTYYVSQTITGCESPRGALVVTVNPTPAAPTVTSPVTYCQNAAAVPLTATGINLLWYTVAVGGAGSAIAPTPSTTASGSSTYYISQTQGGCESPRASIVVIVNPTPAAPTVTSPVTYCQNAAAVTLTATGTNLLWYTAATGGMGSATAPTPSTTASGSTTYYVSQTITGCESPRASIVVIVNPTPTAPTVTSPVTYCQNAAAVPLTATGTNLLWYTAATGGVGSATAPTPSTTASGSATYYVSQTITGCESPRASIVMTVNPTPAAGATNTGPFCISGMITLNASGGTSYSWTGPNAYTGTGAAPTPFSAATYGAGTYSVTVTDANSCTATASTNVVIGSTAAPTVTSPVTYCQNATAAPLTATAPGSLLWYTVTTGGTGSNTAPTPSTAASGSTTYYVSQTQSGCESPRAAITVTVNPTPVATASNTGPFCSDGSITLSASGGTSYSWSGPNGYSDNGSSPAPFSAATYGAGTYTVTVTDANSCTAITSTAVVVNNTSAPTVTSPVIYCQNATALPLTATGTSLLWYTVANGGTGSATAPTPSTAASGSTTYYVSQTQSGCESPRAAITVTVNPTPVATASNTGPFCSDGSITLSASGGTSYSWSGPNGYSDNGSSPAPFSAATYGAGTYTVTVTDANSCTAITSTAVVVNNTSAPIVTSPVIYCQNAAALPLTATGTSLLWYTVATGGTGSATAPTPSTTASGSTTYYVSQTLNGCESHAASMVVIINPTPTATANNTGPYCTNGTITLSATGGTSYSWSGPNGYTGTGASTAPFSAATYGGGTYTVTVTDANSCTATASTPVTVSSTITIPVSQTVCNGQSITFNGQSLSTAGVYNDTLTSVTGCDSIVMLTLTVIPVTSSVLNQSICAGTSYTFNGRSLNTAGTYYDTLTNAAGCDSIITLTLQVNVTLMSNDTQTICDGTSINFFGQNISAAGLYSDTLTASTGCDSVIYLTLNVTPKPVASFVLQPAGDTIEYGNKVSVINTSVNSNSEQWLVNNQVVTLSAGDTLPISDLGPYCIGLITSNAAGCNDTAAPLCIYINTSPPDPFYMPNAFTPNGDGINDFIEVYGKKTNVAYLSIQVYDRWGEKVFESFDLGFKWDGMFKGTLLPPGVYVYLLDITPNYGQTIHNRGSITLIR